MKITWIGHSCFKVEKDGYAIILDPYADNSVPGLAPVRETANLVLCSHEHGDHNARQTVTLVKSEQSPFTVTKIETFHDDVKGAKRGPNMIHLIEDGETKIAHFGDLGCALEPEQVEMLKGVDAALIPVGGFFTIDAKQAAELAEQIKPKILVPMHYRKEGFGFDVIGTVETFTALMPSVAVLPDSTIDSADQYDAQVIVLQAKNSCENK